MDHRPITIFQSARLLQSALDGDAHAIGHLLEHFRPYLVVIAHRQLDGRLRGRMDANDVVQTTFLEAHRDFKNFKGTEINSFLAWLRQILHHNIEGAHQEHIVAQKRSAARERSPTTSAAANDSAPLIDLVPAETSSPSQRIMRDERAASLAECLLKLPDTQAEAIRLRYLEGWPLKAISERMSKSELAVAGLLKRGLRSLRSDLASLLSSEPR